MSLIHSDLLEDQEEIDSDDDNPPLAHTPEKPSGHWRTFKTQDVLSKQADPVHAAYVKLRAEAHAEIAEFITFFSEVEEREARIKALQEATEDSNARTKALQEATEEREARTKALRDATEEGLTETAQLRAEADKATAEVQRVVAETESQMRDFKMQIERFRQSEAHIEKILASVL
ncbi:hypothetical protein DXG03_004553 [Asterophora parasitica]|uniref:Uncharacterized protein n=1 Tax=Asterophora parasitica TaxID=117018 RepID=A0A9P7FRP4_9AGAR|nr:hypothetical protein DXG03_004553 [Asterophora parasitica]